ncbi:MAG: S46 family peptidase, partial [Bacteroidales bacterium]|nr:S46 family peptidase [Bacteroidales bacterium]
MKKLFLALSVTMLLIGGNVRADEGMWLPMLIERLNYTDMQKMGLQLTPEEIYSVNQSSLKDAIIIFGRGCTGEIISGQGLVLTNHHCGYGAIQANSSVEHDYLTDGFWARSLEEELKNDGLIAKFLVRMDDVTARVLDGISADMSEADRAAKIKERTAAIEKEVTEGTHYDAVVKDFFYGNEYYVFVYETFKDVRLVGAPPSSIGKFGFDTDNWMWPRHTGDFSLFRIYTAPDGKPAEYSKDNIPLKPKHFLPISMDGVKKGDFSMILGNPGSTSRYMTSY